MKTYEMEIGLAVFVVMWIYYNLKLRKRRLEYEKKIKEIETTNAQNAQLAIKWYNEYENLSVQFNELKKRTEQLTIENKKFVVVKDTGNAEPFHLKEVVLPKEQVVLYFPVPNRNGSFPNNGSTSFNASQHMYQFTIMNEQGTKARFKFINHELTTKDALNDPQVFLRPVCQYENTISSKTLNIRTIEEGWAEKTGNSWNIIQKAMIHFEEE